MMASAFGSHCLLVLPPSCYAFQISSAVSSPGSGAKSFASLDISSSTCIRLRFVEKSCFRTTCARTYSPLEVQWQKAFTRPTLSCSFPHYSRPSLSWSFPRNSRLVEDGRDTATAGKDAVCQRRWVRAEAGSSEADDGFSRSKLAVFLSGAGSNFRAIHAGCVNNSIYGDIALVISDKPGCKGCEFARQNDVPVLSYPISKHAPEGLSVPDLVEALKSYGIDYVLLAGYLKRLPSELVLAYRRSILNVHPSLLPSFGGKGYYGMKVHEAVVKSGVRYSGVTIHFVDEDFDTGPILAQRTVPVSIVDTPQDLAAKVLKVEHLLYTEAVAALCEDRIFWREDGVPFIRKSWIAAEYT